MHKTEAHTMKSKPFSAMSVRARPWISAALACMLAVAMVACGGGGTVPVTGVQSLRPLPADFATRKAVNYSPYRTATSESGLAAEAIPEANIKQDLDLLVAAGFGLIRLFDSSDKVAKATLNVIWKYGLDIKVQLGAYVLSGSDGLSRAELARCVALANDSKYRDIIVAVSVGNETMVSWAFNKIAPALMADYIRTVRSQITQPVTTDDNWAFWASAPLAITDVVDFASVHTYVLLDTYFDPTVWNWRFKAAPDAERAAAMMDGALVATHQQYAAARSFLDRRGLAAMPITIGETGWKAEDTGGLRFRTSPVNQQMYFERLQAWVDKTKTPGGPTNVFYFEAFDEPWKQGDDKWGLFNKDRQARCVIQSSWVAEPGVNCALSQAVRWVPPVYNAPVTADRFKLYSDAPATASEVQAANLVWDPFGGSSVFPNPMASAAAPGDGAVGLELSITPANYGWGTLLHANTGATVNLSNFAATGALKFWVKTAYAGKIEIGIHTDTDDRDEQKAYFQLANGDYGYCNTNQWCQVTIPMSAFLAVNPKLDPQLLLLFFVISDVYAETGNTPPTAALPVINIDGITWTK
jgi:exo-beta-1,3-glucanase (GH17 family)